MATVLISQAIVSHDSTPTEIPWETREVLRIEALSDEQVHGELQRIMDGYDYSWYRISQLLQEQLDKEVLKFTLEDGDVVFEWNNLCSEKQRWERKGRLSASCPDFYKDCLINLKIIPLQGGLTTEGPHLVESKLDPPSLLSRDLWVFPNKWESFTTQQSISNNDESSWSTDDSEDFEYGEGEDDSEDLEHEEDEYASYNCSEEEAEEESEDGSGEEYEVGSEEECEVGSNESRARSRV